MIGGMLAIAVGRKLRVVEPVVWACKLDIPAKLARKHFPALVTVLKGHAPLEERSAL
jgi:hypothetical protein